MLINAKLPLDSSKFAQEDQILTLTGASWSDYEKLDSIEYGNYLISYLNGQITIMSPGRNHERIVELIGILVLAYCENYEIPCFPFGSTRLEAKGKEGKEPDNGYAFCIDKDIPDLAIEVNFTSGDIGDLTKYKYLKIKEVWIYQDREIKFYALEEGYYQKVEQSINLKQINSKQIINYINQGFTGDVIGIKKAWLRELRK